MRLLREGKVKNIFELESGNLLMVFSDRVSAFDVKFDQRIPNKGKVLCRFADYWFNKLNVPNHFIGMRQNNAMEVRKLSMIPYEFIVRGTIMDPCWNDMLQTLISSPYLEAIYP